MVPPSAYSDLFPGCMTVGTSFENIKLRRPGEFSNFSSGLIQAIVFEVGDRVTIGGSAYGGQRAICCTADLAKLGVCTQGEIIYRPSTKNLDWPQVFVFSFDDDKLVATLPTRSIEITKTGMYNLYFIHCDPRLKEVILEGKTIWKNPTGYLPGRMAPLMKFYGIMSLAFVILGVFWFSQNARFWREVLPLQNCVTLVITLAMFEMAFWYFDYAQFNTTGVRPTGITVWAVTFGTVKRTVARLIILMVSMGYGVVRPTLGGLTSKVIMLGVTFFMASEVLELVENVGAVSDLSGKARLFLVLPVAILDAFFILWIFTSLSATLTKLQVLSLHFQGYLFTLACSFSLKKNKVLSCTFSDKILTGLSEFDSNDIGQAKRMMAKLDIYRKFTNALALTVIVSVGWICYEVMFVNSRLYLNVSVS